MTIPDMEAALIRAGYQLYYLVFGDVLDDHVIVRSAIRVSLKDEIVYAEMETGRGAKLRVLTGACRALLPNFVVKDKS